MGPRFIALAVSLIAGSASGCALVESAAEVTVGKGQLPRLEVAFDLPSVDDLVGDGLPSRIQGEPLTGVPGSLQATTLGHLQGVLGLSGSCLRTHAIASDEPEEGKESAVADVQVEIIGCPTGGWCSAWCGEQTGVMLRFGAEMTFIDDKKAANVRKQLSAEVGDAIAQIRVRFLQLTLEAGGLFLIHADGEEVRVEQVAVPAEALEAFDVSEQPEREAFAAQWGVEAFFRAATGR